MTGLSEILAIELGSDVATMRPLSGGDMAESFAVVLADGRQVFAKTHAAPPPGFFSREADDLRWLRAVGALPVPEVVVVSDEAPAHLVLEWIEPGGHRQSNETEFGRGLASLHLAGSEVFGRTDGRTTGSQAYPTTPATRGPSSTSPPDSTSLVVHPHFRPGCMATCGRATAWSTPAAAAG